MSVHTNCRHVLLLVSPKADTYFTIRTQLCHLHSWVEITNCSHNPQLYCNSISFMWYIIWQQSNSNGDGRLTQHDVDSEAEAVRRTPVELIQFHPDRFVYHWNLMQLHTVSNSTLYRNSRLCGYTEQSANDCYLSTMASKCQISTFNATVFQK